MAPRAGLVWPLADERRLLGRFYLAVGLSTALYLVYPFQFAYLYLAMRRPEWSVLPLMTASAATLVMQLPTGVLADRWGRKPVVLSGGALTAVTFAAVPSTVQLPGSWQLYGTCAAFALLGLGETMMMGAEEAWVVDNLHHAGRGDLVDPFFARLYAITGFGSAVASLLALVVLVTVHVDQSLLDLLWYATAAGFIAAIGVAATIAERRLASEDPGPGEEGSLWQRSKEALTVLVRKKSLLYLMLAIVLASISSAGADEAFPVSLITKGMDARVLGPLGVVDGLLGMGAPILGLLLAKLLGVERLLAGVLVVAGAAVTVLFGAAGIWVVLGLYVFMGVLDQMWDPVAFARLQRDIPSKHRAALGSVMYESQGLAQLVGLGLFAALLGSRSQQLRNATPDLVEAFSGHARTATAVPVGLFGLSLPDLGIVLFVLVGLLAVPFILLGRRRTKQQLPSSRDDSGAKRTAPWGHAEAVSSAETDSVAALGGRRQVTTGLRKGRSALSARSVEPQTFSDDRRTLHRREP